MLETPDHKTVLVIVGPTGIGKSDLAIELARQVNGEIISADSRYLYRGMNIGTAKPTFDQLDSVIHHLVDVAEPDECWSLARFLKETRKKVNEIHRRKRIPILTGGTGQYIRALTEGWRVPEFETDQKLRRVLNQWGQSIGAIGLHEKLRLLVSSMRATCAERYGRLRSFLRLGKGSQTVEEKTDQPMTFGSLGCAWKEKNCTKELMRGSIT